MENGDYAMHVKTEKIRDRNKNNNSNNNILISQITGVSWYQTLKN